MTNSKTTLFLWLLGSQMGCIRGTDAHLNNNKSTSSSLRYSGKLPIGENISIDSPLTPLAKVIRKAALEEFRRRIPQNGDIQTFAASLTDRPEKEGLSPAVQKALVDALNSQRTGDDGDLSTEARPCRIHPELITPAEIVYSLQRAALGRVGEDDPDSGRLRGVSWRKVLGYDLSTNSLLNRFDAWFNRPENEVMENLTPLAAQSLGIKTIRFDTDRFGTDVAGALAPLYDAIKNRRNDAYHIEAKYFETRCFMLWQVTGINIKHHQWLLKFKQRDELESIKYVDILTNMETIDDQIDYINRKDTVVGLKITRWVGNPSFQKYLMNQFRSNDCTLTYDPKTFCKMELPWFNKLTKEAQNRIRIIQFGANSFLDDNLENCFVNMIRGGAHEAALLGSLKVKFPNLDSLIIFKHGSNDQRLPSLLKASNDFGIKSVKLELNPNDSTFFSRFVKDLPKLDKLEALSIEFRSKVGDYSLTQLLAKIPNIRTLSIRGGRMTDTDADFDQSRGVTALEKVRFSACRDGSDGPKIRLTHDRFPKLTQIRLEGCDHLAGRISVSSDKLKEALKTLPPGELIELVQKLRERDDRKP